MPAERAGIFIFNVSLRLKTKKMPEQEKKEKKKLKLNKKYVFMVSNEETMEPLVEFKVNLLRFSLITLATVLVLMVITAVVIIATPLKEYLPGYAPSSSLERQVYDLSRRADSIERELQRKDVYFNNLKLVIEGYDFSSDSIEQHDIYAPLLGINTDTIELRHSPQDSALRAEFEEANFYRLNPAETQLQAPRNNRTANFFTPLIGNVVEEFNPSDGHYGVDVVSTGSQLIKATLDGTVVYASWTLDYGYTIGIQHESSYLSNYKHNATLLKKEGDFVKAGEAIAILGASGELTHGPMLHFELWHNGTPMNPTEYINFEKE